MNQSQLTILSATTRQRIIKAIRTFPVSTAYLFGSQATGNTHAHSDIDLGVLAEPRVARAESMQLRLDLMDALTDILGATAVDVVVLNDPRVSTLLRFNAIQPGVILLDRDLDTRRQFEFQTMRDYYGQYHYQTVYGTTLQRTLVNRNTV